MSARNKKFSFLIFVVLIFGAAVFLTCSDKILNSDTGNAVEFEVALKFSNEETQALAEVVATYQVKIIADNDTITGNLTYSNGSITGLIENVPAGPNRTVIVEGLAGDGTVIYRGTVVITVVANQIVDAEVILLPVAKLLRVSPKFVDGFYGGSFVSNVRISNVPGLTAISFALDYNSQALHLDSIKRGDNVPGGANFSAVDESGLEIEISHSSAVVDSGGNASLAKAYFSPKLSNTCLDSSLMDLGILSLTAPAISVGDVYVDDGNALIKRSNLSVSADTLYFGVGVEGLNLDFKQVDISDLCGNNVGYTITKDNPWIDLNTSLAGITPGSIFVDVNVTGLAAGKYEGRVKINSSKAINSPYEIVVKLEIDKGARTLNVTPGLIVFNAVENGALPASRNIHVEEMFQYNIAFNAGGNGSWLNIDKTAGTTPDSVVVSVNTTALAPGNYFDTVVITSAVAGNSPRLVRIQYNLSAVPKDLEIAPDTLYFTATENGELPPPQKVIVTEAAEYETYFDIYQYDSWIDLSSYNGTTPESISVSINSTEFEPGKYYSYVEAYSSQDPNAPPNVVIVYEVLRAPRILAADPTNLHFSLEQNGTLPAPQTFRVFETSGYVTTFSATEEASWFSISGVSGTTPDNVTVSITTSELSPGMYRDSIQISSGDADNSPIWVEVSLGVVVGPRTIEVDPDSLHFEYIQGDDAYPTAQFRVFESDGYEIAYSYTENIPWLFLSEADGITEDTITVYTIPDLAPGTYVDSIQISAEAAENSPVYVVVTLDVIANPKYLQVSMDPISFVYTPYVEENLSHQIVISEAQGHEIQYSISKNAAWLSFTESDGLTPDSIVVSASYEGLAEGFYFDTLVISSDEAQNSPLKVPVTFEVNVNPIQILTIPDTLSFTGVQNGELPDAKEFVVGDNVQLFPVPFAISESISWLELGGVDGYTFDSIGASITTTELDPGTYFDSVKITSDTAGNTPVYLFVKLNVQEEPKYLVVEPESINLEYIQYSDAIPTGSFNVTELNSYQISFDAVENSEWITINEYDGLTPQTVNFNVSVGLEPGIYVDTIVISSDEALNSPRFVVVTLEIIYHIPPDYVLNPDTLYFSAVQFGPLPDSQVFSVGSTVYPVNYHAKESIPWLDISNANNLTGSFVGVHITSTELSPVTYFDSIMVSLPGERDFEPVYEYIVYSVAPFVDSISPAAVNDLKVNDNTNTSAFLSWTASGDDGNIGTAVETDIRYSTSLETLLAWENASQANGEPSPQPAGNEENFEVTGLTPQNTYYFALDIIDDAGNHSGISNVDSVYLPPFAPQAPILVSPDSATTDVPLSMTFVWHNSNGADYYELEYDTDGSFEEPYRYSELDDTTLSVGPLNYETNYYWRVRASNNGGTSNWSNVWSFITVATPPTIKGIVADNEGVPLSDAAIVAYDSYPNGNILGQTTSDAEGKFKFFDITGAIELYAFKDSYYPQVTTIEAPDTNVFIFLLPTPEFAPSDQWVDLFCELSYSHGNLIQPNDVIEAYDPDGILCGRFVVHTEGAYGYMHVYRDDATSPGVDEGCVTGNAITIKLNGEIALPESNLIYPASYQLLEACFNVTGEIPKWLVISKPAGGETFYQDSSISIEWASTGITGPVEIALFRAEREVIVLDTSINDGRETVTIPVGVTNSAGWQIRVRDLDEDVSDYSESFTISSVELLINPSSLLLHGVTSDCLLDSKQFTISEKGGLSVPFEISDTISWLSVSTSSGVTPALITVNVLSNPLAGGTYESDLIITSVSAINPSLNMTITLENNPYVCGDFNNDCRLIISDLSNLVDYLYRNGSAPVYADALNVNLCDGVDIADVDFLYDLTTTSPPALCQGAEVCTDNSYDSGLRDSIGFVVAQAPVPGQPNTKLKLDLYLFNDANTIEGLAAGFDWVNPNMNLDSVRFAPYVKDSLSIRFAYEKDKIDTTNAHDRFLFAANNTLFSGIPASPAQKLLASYYFTLSSWNASDSIVVDTATFNQGTTYKVVTSNGSYQPIWHGPVIIKEAGF